MSKQKSKKQEAVQYPHFVNENEMPTLTISEMAVDMNLSFVDYKTTEAWRLRAMPSIIRWEMISDRRMRFYVRTSYFEKLEDIPIFIWNTFNKGDLNREDYALELEADKKLKVSHPEMTIDEIDRLIRKIYAFFWRDNEDICKHFLKDRHGLKNFAKEPIWSFVEWESKQGSRRRLRELLGQDPDETYETYVKRMEEFYSKYPLNDEQSQRWLKFYYEQLGDPDRYSGHGWGYAVELAQNRVREALPSDWED